MTISDRSRENAMIHRRVMRKRVAIRTLHYAALVFCAAMTLFPLLWSFFASMRSDVELYKYALPFTWHTIFPVEYTFESYRVVLTELGFPRAVLNTLLVIGIQIPFACLINSIAAFSFSTFEFKGKKLLPNVFLNSRNRISEMRRLYVPYWLFSCDACADMVYDAEKVCTEQKGEWEITRTKHYLVRRRGGMRFENIPVDGSVKMDDKLTESLEPYDLSAAIPFQSAVLAGAMADHADADCDACEKRAVERVERSVEQTMLDTVRDYDTVNERSRRIVTERGSATPALLPVWLMTTVKEGKTYTFAVNGQTGKLTCDVPADKKKSLLWGGGVFAGVFGVAALILALMDALGSGSLLICAVVAAIIALAVVGALKGQLKQAAQQSAAGGYVREGSFRLDVNADHFLYESTTKRKIENNTQKK